MAIAEYPGMTDLAIELRKVKCEDYRTYMDEVNEIIKSYETEDDVVGSVLRTPRADGYAMYEVCWRQGSDAYLRHIAVGDAWTDPTIEDMGEFFKDPLDEDGYLIEVPLKFVKRNLEYKRKMRELFEKAKAS
jgi:hypothetical protein